MSPPINKIMLIDAIKSEQILKESVNDRFKRDLHERGKITGVLIINASDDAANLRYINTKYKMLDSLGVRCKIKTMSKNILGSEIIDYIKHNEKDFDAIMIQSPVYDHLCYDELVSAIPYKKDIDGLHPMNQGLFYSGDKSAIATCTLRGVFELMFYNNIDFKRKNVVIVGRGKLIADPLSKLFENNDCTVTKIHTKTDPELSKYLISKANIIVSCAGRDLSDMINPDTVGDNLEALIGVGFRYENGKQLQDFDCRANWKDVKVTKDTKSTGLATVIALVGNLLKITY